MIWTGKIKRPFLAKFLSALLLGVSAATRADNSGGLIGNDYNSDGGAQYGRRCVGRFVRYNPVTVTSN
jgi:hypothetical protein